MKNILCLLFAFVIFYAIPVRSAETDAVSAVTSEQLPVIEQNEAKTSEKQQNDAQDVPAELQDMMDDGSAEGENEPDMEALNIHMSKSEKEQYNSTSVDVIDNIDELPDLACSDENLRKQVEQFIYQNISSNETYSAVERRQRVLLIRNMHTFEEISQDEIKKKDGFNIQSILMNLRINQSREVKHICVSKGNDYNGFQSIYFVIYQFANLYKVVVSNLLETTSDLEPATFVYNW